MRRSAARPFVALSSLLLPLLLLVLLLLPRAARACAAAQRLRVAPYAPGVPITDAAGESFGLTDLVADDFALARAVANLSAVLSVRLCYWSQQALPSPPTGLQPGGACEPSPCAWPPLPASADEVDMLTALGAQAIARMTLMDAGAHSFLGSTCGAGSGNAAVACAAHPGSVWCAKGMLAQRTRWAVASNIVEMTPATIDAVIANVTTWRGSAVWHLPAITSLIVQRGWGFGGGITAKIIPCDAVPAPLVGTSFGCDALDPATGATVYDEAFSFWSGYKTTSTGLRAALARLREELATTS